MSAPTPPGRTVASTPREEADRPGAVSHGPDRSAAADGTRRRELGRSGGRGTDASGAGPRVARPDVAGAPDRRSRLADRFGALFEAGLDRVGLGHLAHRVGQLVRYGAVSIIATLTSMTVLGALVATATLTPGWANVVATGVGTVPSFELNRRWVWGKTGRRSVRSEIGPFCVLSFAGLALSTALVSAAGNWALGAQLPTAWRTAVVLAANVVAFGSLWVLQFLVLDRVLFSRRGPGPRTDGSGASGSTTAPDPRGRAVAAAVALDGSPGAVADSLGHRAVPGGARAVPTTAPRSSAPPGRTPVAA